MPEEEDRIKQQIADVEFLIDREINEFDKLHPAEAAEELLATQVETNKSPQEALGEPRTESPPHSSAGNDPTNPPAQVATAGQTAARKSSLEENSGEVIVEADEDTVIY